MNPSRPVRAVTGQLLCGTCSRAQGQGLSRLWINTRLSNNSYPGPPRKRARRSSNEARDRYAGARICRRSRQTAARKDGLSCLTTGDHLNALTVTQEGQTSKESPSARTAESLAEQLDQLRQRPNATSPGGGLPHRMQSPAVSELPPTSRISMSAVLSPVTSARTITSERLAAYQTE